MVILMTSCGCPFHYVFCDTLNIHGARVRTLGVDNILRDPKWFYSFQSPKAQNPFLGRIMMEHLPPETVSKYIRLFYLQPNKVYEFIRYFKLGRFIFEIALKFFSVVKKNMSYTSAYK